MAHLIFKTGEAPLIEYRLRPGRTTIGRADSCDVSLPGGEISRTHCFIDGEGGQWRVIDRSRHGILVDGQRATRAELRDGSVIRLGPYVVEVRLSQSAERPTDEAVAERPHELILATDDGSLHIAQPWLLVVAGPDRGKRHRLGSPRLSVGAGSSNVRLADPDLVAEHVRLRISRGRVMVEPGRGAAFLDGSRVRDITPLLPDDELSIGQTVLRVELEAVSEEPKARQFGEMVGESAPMQKLFGTLRRYAGHHFPVLITGESGTGKELAARGIHEASSRAAGPFVPINCGAIATNLFESELFGHEKGAFTGADSRKDGAFHKADGGTLFLDEIGELPMEAQAKLLRALESGEIRRVGSTAVSWPDVRVVAATNRDLAAESRRGAFREDLFFRLAVLSVRIPPLRERREDIPSLARALARSLSPDCRLSEDALALLQRHGWPGNVRELRNVLTRAFVLEGPRIEVGAISFHDLGAPPPLSLDPVALDEAERAYIEGVLRQVEGNRSAAARILGMARTTLQYKMQRLGIA